MQLKEILIHNIASLKGTHRLQFSSEFFNENLFAITGPTGSGKSTILAAISLGLYGNHYKEKLNTIELITLGEATGRCEVHFNYQGQTYKSIWEGTVLKNNGEPLAKPKISRTLFRLTNDSYEAINEHIEDILKLNFEQFCKTVILNQGEFNRFITSDFKERKEILERLADNQKIEEMNKRLNKDILETKNEIENKQNWIEGRRHLSDDNVQEIKQRISNYKEELVEKHQEFSQFTQNYKKFNEILKNLKSRGENLKRKISLQEQLNIKNKELNDIKVEHITNQKLFDEANHHYLQEEPQLRLAEEALVKKLHLEENIIRANSNLSQKQKLIKQLISEEGQLLDSIDVSLKKKKILSEQIHFRVFTVDERKLIEDKIQILNQLNQQFLITQKELEISQNEITLKAKSIEEISSDSTAIEEQRKILTRSSPPSLEALTKKQDSNNKELIQLETSRSACNDYIKYFPEIEVNNISPITLSNLLSDKKKIIQEKEKKLEFYELAIAIGQCHEESLKKGNCVVCGQNMLSGKISPEVQSAIHTDLKDEKQRLSEVKKELIFIESASHKILTFFNQFKIQNFIEFDQYFSNLKKENLLLTQSVTLARENEKQLASLSEKSSFLKQALNKIESEITQLKSKTRELSHNLNFLTKDITAIVTSIESYLNETLAEAKLPLLINDLKISTEIDHLLQTGEIQDGQLKSLNERKISEQIFLQKGQDEIQSLNKEITTKAQFIKTIVGDNNPKLVIQEKLSLLEQLGQTKNKILDRLHQSELGVKDYEGRLKMAQEQIDSLSNLIISLFHQFKLDCQKLLKEECKLWSVNDQYKFFLKGIIENFDLTRILDSVDETALDMILNQTAETLTQYQTHIKQIEKEVIEGEANLKTMADQKEQINLAIKFINEKTKTLIRLKNLYDVIGKDEFRNFILSLIEKQLLILANNELKNLCNDRYELIQTTKKANQIPEFFVIDKLSGGLRRNIFTLSGGETFLISLAMALGLAEMTRGQAEINSFFIDEGFGTLDHDTIEEVLEVLERMQTRGKQIGVISHIKSLTDRIPMNIQLTKNGQGHSFITYIQN